MKEGSFKVTTTKYSFIMDVIYFDNIYTIKYGDVLNREGPCMELTYNKTKPNIIKLDSLQYDARCSVDQLLQRKEGTRDMIQSILKVCLNSFPSIKRVLFNDVSAIVCKDRNLYLSYFYLVNNGQTWYEKYFGAKMVDKTMREKLKKFKDLLALKPKPNIFPREFGPDFTKPEEKDKYHTWYEFFNTKPCEFFTYTRTHHEDIDIKTAIERVSGIKFVYSEWYIPQREINEYSTEIVSIKKTKPFTGGGERHILRTKNQHF